MGIGVVVLVVGAHRVEHRAGFLRRRRGIQVVQGRASGKERKIAARSEAGCPGPSLLGSPLSARSSARNFAHGILRRTFTFPSSTRTSYTATGSIAGPRRTSPVRHEYCAPCQTHSIVPSFRSVPSDSGNSACVQTLCTAPTRPRKLKRQISSPADVRTPNNEPSAKSATAATVSNACPGSRSSPSRVPPLPALPRSPPRRSSSFHR